MQRPSLSGLRGPHHMWEAWVTCVLACKNVPTEWFCLLFAGGAPEFRPFRTSFYIHFLAWDFLNHINSANLEFLHVCGTAWGFDFSWENFFPFRAPGRWQSCKAHPGLAAGIPLTSFSTGWDSPLRIAVLFFQPDARGSVLWVGPRLRSRPEWG